MQADHLRDDGKQVQLFWWKVYELYRWHEGISHHDAEDLAQSFVLKMLRLGRHACHLGEGGMEPALLRASAWRFLAIEWRSQKRLKRHIALISWDEWQTAVSEGGLTAPEVPCRHSLLPWEREEIAQKHAQVEVALTALRSRCGAELVQRFETRALDTETHRTPPMKGAERVRLCRALDQLRNPRQEAPLRKR